MKARNVDTSAKKKPLPDGYEVLLEGAGGYDVVIRTKAKKELKKRATKEQQAGLEDVIQRYAKAGPSGVPPKKFNGDEGWFPSDKAAGKIRLEAFKPWQLRAYGFCRTFNARPTFFITGIDPAKKQDGANQSILASAGAEAVRLNKSIGEGV